MVNSHSTQAYIPLIIHCKVLYEGVVHIIFQVVFSHRKEYGLTRDY